ncbi:hypothetical protein [Kitasatospora sp. NPDC101183]|uniref:hypothetical protein n=1 Tax=Kitasatospora sp. NPDC101183 TaxID=3364100 RepID=UPI0038044D08
MRISALTTLYALEQRSGRDSRKLDLIEAALSLALGEKRVAESAGRLVRNVLNDARRIADRSEQNGRESASKRPLPDAIHRRTTQVDDQGTATVDLVSYETPESHVVAEETLRELTTYAATVGAHGTTCLLGLLRDQTAAQTAAAAHVSIATVERAWKGIRAHTRFLLTPVPA